MGDAGDSMIRVLFQTILFPRRAGRRDLTPSPSCRRGGTPNKITSSFTNTPTRHSSLVIATTPEQVVVTECPNLATGCWKLVAPPAEHRKVRRDADHLVRRRRRRSECKPHIEGRRRTETAWMVTPKFGNAIGTSERGGGAYFVLVVVACLPLCYFWPWSAVAMSLKNGVGLVRL
jgi:hypothetical protein